MVYLKEMVNSRQKCKKFRIRWKGPCEVIRRLSDLNCFVKLSRTKEIVNVNKMKCFRQTAIRPTTKQRSTRNRAEDKPETLETYGTRYTTPDSVSYKAVLIALGDNNLWLCYKMWMCFFSHLLLKGHMPIRSPEKAPAPLFIKTLRPKASSDRRQTWSCRNDCTPCF